MISEQASEWRANCGLFIARSGVRLVGKGEKGWRWGKEMTVAKMRITLSFGGKCPMRPLLDWRLTLCSVFY